MNSIEQNNLPRIDKNTSTRNSIIGGLQIAIGVLLLLLVFIMWTFRVVVFNVLFSTNPIALSLMHWIFVVIAVWFLSAGFNRLTVNDTFKQLRSRLGKQSYNIVELSQLMGTSPQKLLDDVSIMLYRKYWQKIRVLDSTILVTPVRSAFDPEFKDFRINAEEGMRFSPVIKRREMPHPVVATILVALAALLPLPLSKVIWIILAVALSFPLRPLFNMVMPKRKCIAYSQIPEYIPEKIELKLSGDEATDGLLTKSKKELIQLAELSEKIKDPHLNKNIKGIYISLKQMTEILAEQPEKHRSVRQTIDYSIPTAIDLFEKYIELDAQPNKGENIQDAIKRIHEMSDLVLNSLKKEVDGLYTDVSLDIEVDVEVMRNMLQEEHKNIEPLISNIEENEDVK